MVRQKKVCVIGAGVVGLVTAKVFKARGHQVTIMERSGDRFNSTVIGMKRRQGMPGWMLEIKDRALQVSREDFDFVAACTGHITMPVTATSRHRTTLA